FCFFFFQAEDGIRDRTVTGVQTCALPISGATIRCCSCTTSMRNRERFPSRSGFPATPASYWSTCWRKTTARLTSAASTRSCSKRSEEHTSELQSPYDLVCRLLLEKKKNKK